MFKQHYAIASTCGMPSWLIQGFESSDSRALPPDEIFDARITSMRREWLRKIFMGLKNILEMLYGKGHDRDEWLPVTQV